MLGAIDEKHGVSTVVFLTKFSEKSVHQYGQHRQKSLKWLNSLEPGSIAAYSQHC